jgi:hypothetical protein
VSCELKSEVPLDMSGPGRRIEAVSGLAPIVSSAAYQLCEELAGLQNADGQLVAARRRTDRRSGGPLAAVSIA